MVASILGCFFLEKKESEKKVSIKMLHCLTPNT